MLQTPNPNAQPNDPAAWVTTGTPTGSGDPKTVEMLATIQRLTAAYGAKDITTVGPDYANQLLLPDGSIAPLAVAYFDVQWMQDNFTAQVAQKRFLILYWGPRMPTQTINATEEELALAIHTAIVNASTDGRYTGGSTAVTTAEAAAVAAAPASVPTEWSPASSDGSRPSDDDYRTRDSLIQVERVAGIGSSAILAGDAGSASAASSSAGSSTPPWWVFAGVGLALLVAMRRD